MVECGICFAEYQEGELELHRELCVLLLMFRCTLCNVDFMSKEGLWNHLDLHEIADESKELHCQEMKAKHKLQQCALCNDQRAYSESLYWNHINVVHDGFFLQCSDCGENFRSEVDKNDHVSYYCKVRVQMVAAQFADLEVDQVPIKIENVTFDPDEAVLKDKKLSSSLNSSDNSIENKSSAEHFSNAKKGRSRRKRSTVWNAGNDSMIKKTIADPKSSDTNCNSCNKEFATVLSLRAHILFSHKPIKCSVCGITNYGTYEARYHKVLKHMEPSYECAKCLKTFHFITHYKNHLKGCDPDHSFLRPETKHLAREATRREKNCFLDIEFSNVQQIDDSECTDGLTLKDRRDPEMLVENPSSEQSSENVCSHCGIKEFNAVTLVRHILTHHEPVACDICGVTSSNLLQAQQHKKTQHKRITNKCPHCSMLYQMGKQFERHVLKCESSKFYCEFCGKKFILLSSVTAHKKKCPAKTVRNDRINGSEESQEQLSDVHDGANPSAVIEKTSLAQSDLSESKCYYCNKTCPNQGYLYLHLKKYHELTRCDICGITILGISPRNAHEVRCHKEAKFVCLTCGKNFYLKRQYDSHCLACERKKHSCEICGAGYKNLNSVGQHQRKEHPEYIGQSMVNKSMKDDCAGLEKTTSEHEEICSSKQNWDQEGNLNSSEEIESLDDFRAIEHSASVNHDDDVDSHMNDEESRMPSTLNEGSKIQLGLEQTSQSRIENSPVQKYRCNICDITSSEFSDIRQHMLTNHTDGNFQCHICSSKFRGISVLRAHVKVCAERKFPCGICGKRFKFLYSIQKHNIRCHGDNETLSKVIDEDTECTGVQKSDTIEDTDYEKSSDQNSAMQLQGVNQSIGSCQVKCPYCVKSFARKDLLSGHIGRCHEPCACDICGLTFVSGLKAKYHKIKIHFQHKKFECPYCPMKYRMAELYEQHLSMCKKREFSCDLCGKKYKAPRFVVKHKLLFHQGNKASKEGQHCRKKGNAEQNPQTAKVHHGKELSLPHDVKEAQISSLNMSHATSIQLQMDIKVEDTMLQE